MPAPKGSRNAAGKRFRTPDTRPWSERRLEHLARAGRTHGGTTAIKEVPKLSERVTNRDAPPLTELTTTALPPVPAEIFRAVRDDLISARGGEEMVSPQERLLIDAAAHNALQLMFVDAWIMSKPTFVNEKKATVLPIVEVRQRIAKQLVTTLRVLGLDRKAKDTQTLEQYLRERAGAQPDAAPTT